MSCSGVVIPHLYKNQGGKVFEVQFVDSDGDPINISTATSIAFNFKKPDNSWAVAIEGALSTTGVDGKIKCTVVADYLSVAGYWRWYGGCTLDSEELRSKDSDGKPHRLVIEDAA